MRMILFSSRQYDIDTFNEANAAFGYELHVQESNLDAETAILADGYEAVCPFVNDNVDAAVIERLRAGGTRLIALRSAGFNHVDLAAAERAGQPPLALRQQLQARPRPVFPAIGPRHSG